MWFKIEEWPVGGEFMSNEESFTFKRNCETIVGQSVFHICSQVNTCERLVDKKIIRVAQM